MLSDSVRSLILKPCGGIGFVVCNYDLEVNISKLKAVAQKKLKNLEDRDLVTFKFRKFDLVVWNKDIYGLSNSLYASPYKHFKIVIKTIKKQSQAEKIFSGRRQ